MLARNSIGRSVSLLNDENANPLANVRHSKQQQQQQYPTLPSISAFFPERSPKLRKTSISESLHTRRSSHASTACHSPFGSRRKNASGCSSPTLSECSTQVENITAATAASSLSAGKVQQQQHQQQQQHYSPEHQAPRLFGQTINQRPKPTPLITNDSQSASSTSSLSINSSSTTTTSSSLPSFSRSSSSTSSSSQYYNTTINNNNNNQHHHKSSIHTPLTPSSPLHTSASHSLDVMDQTKTAYQPTMLSPAINTDAFLYGVHRNVMPASTQYFSISQQPLPQGPIPMTASSPIMYSSLDSPTTVNMLDPYMPLSQAQQQQQAVPFAPYPQELIPGALSRPSNAQSIIATSPSDTSNNSAPKIAKKKYPCPHAAKYNCSDTFTTSGHAARHGKKHTGEKNIHCPVCDKAFTRKDNMKQHERTHRNKGEASKVAEAVESSNRRAAHKSTLSKSSSHSTELEDDAAPPTKTSNPQASIRAANQQRLSIPAVQQAPPSLTSPTAADIPMPVTLDSNETLQPVAPSLQVEPMDKNFSSNMFDHSFISRSQENILGRPSIFERTTSTGSGFSADGEGESPGLDALAMAAELC